MLICELIDGADHWPQQEKPEETVALLLRFLRVQGHGWEALQALVPLMLWKNGLRLDLHLQRRQDQSGNLDQCRGRPVPGSRSQGTRGRERHRESRRFPGFLLWRPLTKRQKPRHTHIRISVALL